MSFVANKSPKLKLPWDANVNVKTDVLNKMDVEKKLIANYNKYIAGTENSWCPF
jgi:hypothetical protein